MTPLRLIQVGLGGWGRDWANLIARTPALAHVVAYVDPVPAMLQQLQAEAAVDARQCFATLDAALAASNAEAVLVTTTLAGHVPTTLLALAAGKHVLVEKPFAPALAEAQQAVDLATTHQRVLMVSQNYRFYPAAQAAAALIRTGVLGQLSAVQVQFQKYANSAPPGNHRHYSVPQPLLIDMAIHHFDLMRYVLGQEPVHVSCQTWNPPWSKFDEPAAGVATIRFDGGALVNYYGNWVSTAAPTFWAGTWQIEGANGVLHWTGRSDRDTADDVVTLRLRGKRARRVPLAQLAYWDRMGALAAFAAAIRQGGEPPASGRDNLGSLALMLAALAAARDGVPVELGQAKHTPY